MNDPLVFGLVAIIVVAIALFLGMRRRPGRGEVEEAADLAAVDADRDREKTAAVEAKEIAGHQGPGESL